jgi:hypothetical protein
MPRVAFEPTTPVFEWARMFYALDRTATVIGLCDRTTYAYSDIRIKGAGDMETG